MRRNLKPALLLPILLFSLLVAMRSSAQEQQVATLVEDSPALPKPRPGTLGTDDYKPSQKELPFFSRLAPNEQRTGDMFTDYSITGKKEKFIGWFGIVRGIAEDKTSNTTRLLVEHKYFDGLTDTHIMALSFNGGGDFKALLSGTSLGIKELSLVKVYGVVQAETDSIPEIKTEYLRQWDWGKFTFLMIYGKQKGNTKWQKLNKAGEKIYNPFPDQKYYEDRLGRRKP